MSLITTPEPPKVDSAEHDESEPARIDWDLVRLAIGYLLADYLVHALGTKLGLEGALARIVGASASVALFLYARWWAEPLQLDLGLTWKQRTGSLPLSICCLLVLGVGQFISGLTAPVPPLAPYGLIFTGVTAPVLEELAFRGLAFGMLCCALGRRAWFWPEIITALCFAMAHAFFRENGTVVFLIPKFTHLLLVGLLLGLLRAQSGSLVFPILGHSLGNVVLWLVLYSRS